jgi:hypothetical protein
MVRPNHDARQSTSPSGGHGEEEPVSTIPDGSESGAPVQWPSPFLKPAPHHESFPPDGPERRWVRPLFLAALAAACITGIWYFRASLGLTPATVISLAPPDSGAAGQLVGDTGAKPAFSASEARHAAAEAAARGMPDSLRQRIYDATRLVGTWYHGDTRSKYGDSLTLSLVGDGTASALERRYSLDRTGWHVARVNRSGTWSVLVRAGRAVQLCTAWTSPKRVRACDDLEIVRDTLGTPPILQFAGRHWRLQAASDSLLVQGGFKVVVSCRLGGSSIPASCAANTESTDQ